MWNTFKAYCKELFHDKKVVMPRVDLKYNPLAIDEDIFIPVRSSNFELVSESSKYHMDKYLYDSRIVELI